MASSGGAGILVLAGTVSSAFFIFSLTRGLKMRDGKQRLPEFFGKDVNDGTIAGRGGRRTVGPAEKMNMPTALWKFGYGGHGANALEYDRRLKLPTQIRGEYVQAFPDDLVFARSWDRSGADELGE